MGYQGALVGAVGAYVVEMTLNRMGIDVAAGLQRIPPFNQPYGGLVAATTVVTLAGIVAGYYYL